MLCGNRLVQALRTTDTSQRDRSYWCVTVRYAFLCVSFVLLAKVNEEA